MLAGVGAIAEQSDGSLVVGMKRSGTGLGLQLLTQDNKWKDYIVPGMNGTELEVTALLTDRDNSLWVGTENHGIYRVHEWPSRSLYERRRFIERLRTSLYEDREGDIWVATSRGIDRFH